MHRDLHAVVGRHTGGGGASPVHRDLLLSPMLLTLTDAVSTCNSSLLVSNCSLNNSQRCCKQCEA